MEGQSKTCRSAAKLDSAKTEPLISVVVIPSGVKVPGQLRRCRRSCKTGAYNQSATIDSNGTVCWVNDELGAAGMETNDWSIAKEGSSSLKYFSRRVSFLLEFITSCAHDTEHSFSTARSQVNCAP